MRHRSVFAAGMVVAGLALGPGVAGAPPVEAVEVAQAIPAATTLSPVGSWGTAQTVPGIPASTTSETELSRVSCAPAGPCVAVGNVFSSTSLTGTVPFITTDQNGSWGRAQQIPGLTTALGSLVILDAVSCPAAGDCLVAGEYGNTTSNGFVVQETGGKWGGPLPVPGLAALDTAGQASIAGMACAAPGYCTVTGDYATGSPTSPGAQSSFIADEVNYSWGTATQVPGLATLNVGGASASSLACPSPRNCTLEGVYAASTPPPAAGAGSVPALRKSAVLRSALKGALGGARFAGLRPPSADAMTPSSGMQVFVDSEVNGTWQQASAPAIPGLTSTGLAFPTTPLACASAGHCMAAGVAAASSSATTSSVFVLTQSGSTWATSTAPGMDEIAALACPGPGTCVAGGADSQGIAATMHQVSGTWGKPADLAGAASLTYKGKKAQQSLVDTLACPSVGNCSAGGAYLWNVTASSPGYGSVFVAGEANGRWSSVLVPAGAVALNSGAEADFGDLSCASAATCAAVGFYATSPQTGGSFLLAEIPLKPTVTAETLSVAKIKYGYENTERLRVTVSAHGATPAGRVTVRSGSRTICVITLRGGTGSCVLTARQLPVGSYYAAAFYPGSFGFGSSRSASHLLTVVR